MTKKSLYDIYRLVYQGKRVFESTGERLRSEHVYYWQHDKETMVNVRHDLIRNWYYIDIVVGTK